MEAEVPKDDSHVFVPKGTKIETRFLAKRGCRHCNGRGNTGWQVLPGGRRRPLICKCLKKVFYAVSDGVEVAVELDGRVKLEPEVKA